MRPHFPFKRLSGSVFCIKAHAAVGCWQTEGTEDHDKADHTLLSWRHWMCLSIGDGRDSGPPFAHLICAFSVVFLSVILYIIHGSRSSIVQLWKLQNHETKNWISDFYIVLIDFLRILFVRVVDFVLRRSTMVNHWLEQRKSFSFHFVSYLAGFPAGDIFSTGAALPLENPCVWMVSASDSERNRGFPSLQEIEYGCILHYCDDRLAGNRLPRISQSGTEKSKNCRQ